MALDVVFFCIGLVMLFTSFLPWLMMRKSSTVKRRDGVILLLCYVGYLSYLIIKT